MCGSRFGGPALHFGSGNLYRGTTLPAHQVMVVVRRAAAVDRFAGISAQRVDLVGRRHRLQGAVDRGQPDVLAAPAEFIVEFLSRAEFIDGVEQFGDCGALPGGPGGAGGFGGGSIAGGVRLCRSHWRSAVVCASPAWASPA